MEDVFIFIFRLRGGVILYGKRDFVVVVKNRDFKLERFGFFRWRMGSRGLRIGFFFFGLEREKITEEVKVM